VKGFIAKGEVRCPSLGHMAGYGKERVLVGLGENGEWEMRWK